MGLLQIMIDFWQFHPCGEWKIPHKCEIIIICKIICTSGGEFRRFKESYFELFRCPMYDINFYHSIHCYERSMSPALSKYRRNERMGMPSDSHAEKHAATFYQQSSLLLCLDSTFSQHLIYLVSI